ncbi:MAG: aminoacetone oxidase family FAD-binding enzyme [Anaerolineae bacterium]
MKRVAIVGAGPAGIAAALQAAAAGAVVTLFDGNALVGRKLLATGNGRCNLSNAGVAPEAYTCADREFIAAVLRRLPPAALLALLEGLGVLLHATDDGWYYPLSNSAAAVVDILTASLVAAGVETRLSSRVAAITRQSDGFTLRLGDGTATTCDRLIVACGGAAYPAMGSRGELFPALAGLGHTIVPPRPALAPIVADMHRLHKLQGVRLDVGLSLLDGKRLLAESVGNLMFTQTGFSGPAPMNISHLVGAYPARHLQVRLNLVPEHLPELRHLLRARRHDAVPLRTLLVSVLPPKVPPVYLALARVNVAVDMAGVRDDEIERVVAALTGTMVDVKGTGDFDVAQLSTGGVPVTEIEPDTMQSRRVSGLYLAGEVLDVVGPCGGYNLHFAFTTGAIAGSSAAA